MKLTKKAVEKAIIGSHGIISTIAQRLQVARITVREYLKRYPELVELIKDEKENILDFTESKLIKKINEEEGWAIKYMLTTQGKKRGYGKEVCENPELPKPELSKPTWFDEIEKDMGSDMKLFMRGLYED